MAQRWSNPEADDSFLQFRERSVRDGVWLSLVTIFLVWTAADLALIAAIVSADSVLGAIFFLPLIFLPRPRVPAGGRRHRGRAPPQRRR